MISIIIPTLNEASAIGPCLSELLDHRGDFEIIVSDGGSVDGTLDVVRLFPEVSQRVSPRGRGRQMNEGAGTARGDIYLFLHADTRLPRGGLQVVGEVMSHPGVAGGSFCLSFDRDHPFLKGISLFTRINHTLFTYGDQALFVSARVFRRIGGYREIPIMEDVDLQSRLRRAGRFVKIRRPVVTSARRFLKYGVFRQQALNTALVFLYHMGISPSRLERFYRSHPPPVSSIQN
jgi:rSAM/selenodomain-associated transferase 2